MNKKLFLFANWKMYLDYDESNILANQLADESVKFPNSVEVAVFPSALSFYTVSQTLRDVGIKVGCQNAYHLDKGGYTGEVSINMFKSVGSDYTLIGHSERRHVFKETNREVRLKLESALAAGAVPLLCVGETLEEKKAEKTHEVIEIQLRAAYQNLEWPKNMPAMIAYEPVWAIGTGKICDPATADSVHEFIIETVGGLIGVEPTVLYGGSVRPENIREQVEKPNISGVLVGQASTKFDTWMEIVKNAS